MSSRLESDILFGVRDALQDAIDNAGLSDVGIATEVRISEYLPPSIEGDFTDLSRTADLLVFKQIVFSPEGLDTIENLERWFPTNSVQVPVAVIDVKTGENFNQFLSSDFKFKNLGLWKYTEKFDETLTILVTHTPYTDEVGTEMSVVSRRGDFILNAVSDVEDEDFQENIAEPIIEHITGLTDETLISAFSLDKIASEFDPELFHFNEVLHAYRHDRDKLLIILLAVFFESYVHDLLDERLSELRENEHAGQFYKNWNFSESLTACRYFGILEESDFSIMNKTRLARNHYAHNFEDYGDESTNLESEGRLDDAVRLYEALIGVKHSMTDE